MSLSLFTMWPSPLMSQRVVSKPSTPTGPRAWILLVLMPTCAEKKERNKQTRRMRPRGNVRQSARHSVSSHILTRIMILILRLPPWDQGIGVLGGLKGSDKGPGEFSSSEESNRNYTKEVLSLAAQALPRLDPRLG